MHIKDWLSVSLTAFTLVSTGNSQATVDSDYAGIGDTTTVVGTLTHTLTRTITPSVEAKVSSLGSTIGPNAAATNLQGSGANAARSQHLSLDDDMTHAAPRPTQGGSAGAGDAMHQSADFNRLQKLPDGTTMPDADLEPHRQDSVASGTAPSESEASDTPWGGHWRWTGHGRPHMPNLFARSRSEANTYQWPWFGFRKGDAREEN